MPIHLPPPIDHYVRFENSGDAAALAECFMSDAVVRDEGRTYQGLAAIKEWKSETSRKYNHTIAPLELAHRDGRIVLKAKLTGNFPGSPVTLDFSFTLERGKIASLEIHG
jgi:hypothetical protein